MRNELSTAADSSATFRSRWRRGCTRVSAPGGAPPSRRSGEEAMPDSARSIARRDLLRGAALAAAGLATAGAATPAAAGAGRVRELIRKVKDARLFDLSSPWDENSPIAAVNPSYSMELNATHAGTRGAFGDGGQLSFTSEVQHWSGQHGAPSID